MSDGSGGERHAHDLAAVRPANRAGVNDPEGQRNKQEGGAPQAGVVGALAMPPAVCTSPFAKINPQKLRPMRTLRLQRYAASGAPNHIRAMFTTG